ncbi:hypothetical protein ALI144C_06800 [Actinosynnema sp. ALI-1.44]|uniref:hypothetical protein n=1 Tax=Actinosynnema sp. ALI-1.44 TaxID=1933779 RepID=UPI00097C8C5F|nr:hypothetical protein [Actinosynnema sp. ALI-1.44]ONI88170.1 hypothetical protein ALI144C_06800 [Actinosynnema sp. ALI-1.44]
MSAKLVDVVHAVHRVLRPAGASVDDSTGLDPREPVSTITAVTCRTEKVEHRLAEWVVTGLAAGFAAAASQRLLDVLVPHRRR